MKHILLSCLLLLVLCATALAAPVEKQTFRVVAPEGWTVTAVPDVSEGVVLVAPDKSVSVTIVTAASGTMTPEQLAADYEQKLHAARVAQNGNYYGLKGMAGDLPLEVCLWTFDGMHGVASIVGRRASWTRWSSTGSPAQVLYEGRGRHWGQLPENAGNSRTSLGEPGGPPLSHEGRHRLMLSCPGSQK